MFLIPNHPRLDVPFCRFSLFSMYFVSSLASVARCRRSSIENLLIEHAAFWSFNQLTNKLFETKSLGSFENEKDARNFPMIDSSSTLSHAFFEARSDAGGGGDTVLYSRIKSDRKWS